MPQVLLDLLELRRGIDRADVGVLVDRIADDQRLHPVLELCDHFLGDRFLHQQPRARAADVALVEEDAVDDALDRLVERGVREDDVGRLAAELERVALRRAGEPALDQPADLGRAGERDLVDVGVLDERGAGFTRAGDDVHDARRQPDVADQLGELERGERRRLRGLQHHRVAAGERRRDLPRRHQQRKVPRDDLAGNAERSRAPPRECVVELVRPAGVVEEVRRGQRHVDVARFADRLAAVERLDHRELARPLLQRARDPVQVLAALGGFAASTSSAARRAVPPPPRDRRRRRRPARPARAALRSPD